jgi:hypothetical protein
LAKPNYFCHQVALYAAFHFQEAGANPNGSSRNLCSPLSIMCQRGLHEGVQVHTVTRLTAYLHGIAAWLIVLEKIKLARVL